MKYLIIIYISFQCGFGFVLGKNVGENIYIFYICIHLNIFNTQICTVFLVLVFKLHCKSVFLSHDFFPNGWLIEFEYHKYIYLFMYCT